MRSRLLALCAVLAAGALLAAGCGSDDGSAAAGAGTAGPEHLGHTGTVAFEGGTISPRRAAPPLVGTDIDGKTVDLRDLRGSPVLVTFVYAHCPDVCPLIMSNLRHIRDESPLGRKLHVIAVSVDPKGDTPAVVRQFLARQRVAGFVDYVIGTRAELQPIWSDWHIATAVPKDNPELVEHSSLIYGVTAGGELATAYPVGFEPEAVARDLKLLATS